MAAQNGLDMMRHMAIELLLLLPLLRVVRVVARAMMRHDICMQVAMIALKIGRELHQGILLLIR